MNNIFQAQSYDNAKDCARAIVFSFLTAGGLNNHQDIEKILAETEDAEIYHSIVVEWFGYGLDGEPEFGDTGIFDDDLEEAIEDFREDRPHLTHELVINEKNGSDRFWDAIRDYDKQDILSELFELVHGGEWTIKTDESGGEVLMDWLECEAESGRLPDFYDEDQGTAIELIERDLDGWV